MPSVTVAGWMKAVNQPTLILHLGLKEDKSNPHPSGSHRFDRNAGTNQANNQSTTQ